MWKINNIKNNNFLLPELVGFLAYKVCFFNFHPGIDLSIDQKEV